MNIPAMKELIGRIEDEQAQLFKLEKALDTLINSGQNTPSVIINGVSFTLKYSDRSTGWMARKIEIYEKLYNESVRLLEEAIFSKKSEIEGLKFKLREKSK